MNHRNEKRISFVFYYLSSIVIIGGFLLFIPFFVGLISGERAIVGKLFLGFILPGFASIVVGSIIRIFSKSGTLLLKDAMVVCTVSWILLTLIGAVPFSVVLDVGYLNSCFETMSGFTTTGITLLSHLDELPRSILFWRAFTQWIGGLGILSMFILIGFRGGSAANKLFLAEGHKVATPRPSPSMFNTARVFWTLYICFTIAEASILILLGLDLFDSITHAMTTISTGGYSIHDSSIEYYRIRGFANADLIEITIMVFMMIGAVSFFVHYRIRKGKIRALWDNTEIRYFWFIIIAGVLLIFLHHTGIYGISFREYNGSDYSGLKGIMFNIKEVAFQVVSILTTTGYTTRDISSSYFTPFAKQIFLILMMVGGCAGSTSGGVKVIRIAILTKLIKNRIIKLNSSRLVRIPLTVDNEIVEDGEIKRIFSLLFMWIILLICTFALLGVNMYHLI